MVEISATYEGDLRTRAVHEESGEILITDAPRDNGGRGKNFSPTDLVAVALGTCVLTIMGIAAKKIGVDMQGARVLVRKEMQPSPQRKIAKLHVDFFFPHALEEAKREQLEKAAMNCPVHASLHPDVEQKFTFNWGRQQ